MIIISDGSIVLVSKQWNPSGTKKTVSIQIENQYSHLFI